MLPLAGQDGFFHVNKAPMKAGPYTIPSGHMLIPSMSAIVMDKDSWREADKFDPTRFIEDGRFKGDERVITFQTGKRVCPGEVLAKAQVFLFLVGLIQKFKFEPEGPDKNVKFTLKKGFTCIPQRKDPIKVTRIG